MPLGAKLDGAAGDGFAVAGYCGGLRQLADLRRMQIPAAQRVRRSQEAVCRWR